MCHPTAPCPLDPHSPWNQTTGPAFFMSLLLGTTMPGLPFPRISIPQDSPTLDPILLLPIAPGSRVPRGPAFPSQPHPWDQHPMTPNPWSPHSPGSLIPLFPHPWGPPLPRTPIHCDSPSSGSPFSGPPWGTVTSGLPQSEGYHVPSTPPV